MIPMYEYTDKVIAYIIKRFIRIFMSAKAKLAGFDELNVISATKEIYTSLEEVMESSLLKLAKKAYKASEEELILLHLELNGGHTEINEAWLQEKLNEYDPVTLYIYLNEIQRMEAKFQEALLSASDRGQVIDRELRRWSNMAQQQAIEITDKAAMQAREDYDVKQVMWMSENDQKRCNICKKRHKKVYLRDKVPPKPHMRCRCWLVSVPGDDDDD